MDPATRLQLLEVFGDPTNVAPSGTGATLTRPSSLDMALADKVTSLIPMDRIFRDLGIVAARELADEFERRGLKPSDYKYVEGITKRVAEMIAKNVKTSEVFDRSLREHLGMRGG